MESIQIDIDTDIDRLDIGIEIEIDIDRYQEPSYPDWLPVNWNIQHFTGRLLGTFSTLSNKNK